MENFLSRLGRNWKSGLTVALVSIPLSISLAVASQVSPIYGIVTAIWAGLVAAIFGGSSFNITGPTGALSGVLAAYVITHGVADVSSLAIIGGFLILVAFVFKLERYLIFVPSSVIHGFTLGVAFIIGLNQTNFALGLSGLPKHENFFENIVESFSHLGSIYWPAFLVFLSFLILLLVLRKLIPRIPGAILLSPIGIGLGYFSQTGKFPWLLETLGTKFGDISFQLFLRPSLAFSESIIVPSITVALVAILETMLSARIADGMTKTKHNQRKEMLGLGLANIVSGLVGGMPATAALARTALNIKTGGESKLSAGVNSIFVALISFFLMIYFRFIPMAVVAAILVFVAIQMIKAEHFYRFYKHEKISFWISLVVAMITIYKDPIVGILVGTAISLLFFVERLSHGQFDLIMTKLGTGIVASVSGEDLKEVAENADILLYSIKGNLCYVNSRAHVERFTDQLLSKYKNVVIRLREVYFMDLDGIEALDEIIDLARSRNQKVLITSANENLQSLLRRLSVHFSELEKSGLVFPKTEAALASLGVTTIKKSA